MEHGETNLVVCRRHNEFIQLEAASEPWSDSDPLCQPAGGSVDLHCSFVLMTMHRTDLKQLL